MSLVDSVSEDAEQAVEHFGRLYERFALHFSTKTRTMSAQAEHYLHSGLVCQGKGNILPFERIVPGVSSM